MTEQNFQRIAQMLARLEERMDARFEQIDGRFEQIDARFEQIDATVKTFKREIISEFNHSLDIKYEELFHRIGLLRDGVADVVERVEGVNQRLDVINAKVDDNSLKLLAHRRDLTAHNRPDAYLVKENETCFGEVPPVENDGTEGAELQRRREESRKKYDAVTDEINAYCAEKGVELPKIDGEEVIRQIRLESARYRVEQELKSRSTFSSPRRGEAGRGERSPASHHVATYIATEADMIEQDFQRIGQLRVEQELRKRREEGQKPGSCS